MAYCAVAAAVFFGGMAEASACGGFFCNNQQPVDQAGEGIVFAVEGETVTAHIQIDYQGQSDKFSWLLPLPTVPTFALGTNQLFMRLQGATAPQHQSQFKNNPECQPVDDCEWGTDDTTDTGGDWGDATGDDTGTGDTGEGGVSVLDEGDIGPFEYVALESDDAVLLYEWLDENGYDQPEEAKDIMAEYVAKESKFVALKLKPNTLAGTLPPIALTFDSPDLACVPLRLTRIAATDDMPINVWVLGQARAVPLNWFHVVLNTSRLDWSRCGWNYSGCRGEYSNLVGQAIDSANGHAFITEFAGRPQSLSNQFFPPIQESVVNLIASAETPLDALKIFFQNGTQNTPELVQILRKYIPKPPASDLPPNCQNDNQFYQFNAEACLKHMPEDYEFDGAAFAAEIMERVVNPVTDAAKMLVKYPYVTRLFSMVSPDEMTSDPIFSFNPDLPDVPRMHKVVNRYRCAEGSKSDVVAIEHIHPDGSSWTKGQYKECVGFVDEGLIGMGPIAAHIQVMGESGPATDIAPDDVDAQEADIELRMPTAGQADLPQALGLPSADIASGLWATVTTELPVLGGHAPDVVIDETPEGPKRGGESNPPATPEAIEAAKAAQSDSGCSQGGEPTSSGAWMLLMLVLSAAWRRSTTASVHSN